MIDINELRRLAQAATPGPWINHGRQPNAGGLPHSAVAAKTLLARVYSEAYGDVAQETANADLIAAASPAAISELLDRLEAAEAEVLEQARLNGMGSEREAALMAKLEAAERERDSARKLADSLALALNTSNHERDNLQAKIEAMEKQEPVAWMLNCQTLGGDTGWILSWTQSGAGLCNRLKGEENEKKLYALPGAQAQPAPVDNDKSVRKAWARFSNELHRSPDAPYPGMAEAFEHHFSQSFKDREWRAESGTWAAAWKAAKHHARASAHAQPAPSVPTGWKLVPIEPDERMLAAARVSTESEGIVVSAWLRRRIYDAMLAAAPEAKP